MIETEVSSGDITTVKKMKVITGDNRAEVTNTDKVGELAKVIVEGETFVFSIDDIGIAMQPVESSTISHLGWFNKEMFVTFKNKKTGFTMYGYTGISDTRFADLVNAKSIGRRFGLMKEESLKDYVRFF
jgi:hypothetical protein